jgi:hypothetical protein
MASRILVECGRLAIIAVVAVSCVAGSYGLVKLKIHAYLENHVSATTGPGHPGATGTPAPPTRARGTVDRPPPPLRHPARDTSGKEITGNLILLGTVTGKPETSFAIIKERISGIQKLYRPGHPIRNGILHEIFRDRVVILVGDKKIVLVARGESETGDGDAPARVNIKQRDLSLALEDVTRTLGQVKIRARDLGENGRGIEILNVAPESIYETLGLRPGDIVQAVNDIPIENPQLCETIHGQLTSLPVGLKLENLEAAPRALTGINPDAAGIGAEISSMVQRLQSGEAVVMKLRRNGRVHEIAFDMGR